MDSAHAFITLTESIYPFLSNSGISLILSVSQTYPPTCSIKVATFVQKSSTESLSF